MLAAFIAACWAAKGVPLREPRKPSEPELFHETTFPSPSEMVTMVLLNDAWMLTTPWGTFLRSRRLNCFFLPFFSGAPAPAVAPAAAGLAIGSFASLVPSSQNVRAGPHWELGSGNREA